MAESMFYPVSEEDIEKWREKVNNKLIFSRKTKAGGVNFYPENLLTDALQIVKTLRNNKHNITNEHVNGHSLYITKLGFSEEI